MNTAPASQPPNGTCTLQPQVVEFQKVFGTYRPGDIAVQWSGINDINITGINTQAKVDAIVATNVANQTEMPSEHRSWRSQCCIHRSCRPWHFRQLHNTQAH